MEMAMAKAMATNWRRKIMCRGLQNLGKYQIKSEITKVFQNKNLGCFSVFRGYAINIRSISLIISFICRVMSCLHEKLERFNRFRKKIFKIIILLPYKHTSILSIKYLYQLQQSQVRNFRRKGDMVAWIWRRGSKNVFNGGCRIIRGWRHGHTWVLT